jgi:hypothetical protein
MGSVMLHVGGLGFLTLIKLFLNEVFKLVERVEYPQSIVDVMWARCDRRDSLWVKGQLAHLVGESNLDFVVG